MQILIAAQITNHACVWAFYSILYFFSTRVFVQDMSCICVVRMIVWIRDNFYLINSQHHHLCKILTRTHSHSTLPQAFALDRGPIKICGATNL